MVIKMTGLKLLKRDIVLGTVRKWYRYIIVVIVACVASLNMYHIIQSWKETGNLFSDGTFLDAYLYATKGMEIFQFSPRNMFSIPVYWFTFQIGIHYIIAYYPEKDYRDYGNIVFLSAKSRSKWWMGKCMWCLTAVFLYYCVAIGTIAVMTLLNNGILSLDITEEIAVLLFGSNMQYVSSSDMLYIALVVPILMTMALCLIQMLFSFLISPVVSFAAICGVYVLSAYYTAWWLPANYTMWLRSSYVQTNGINPDTGLVIGTFLILTSVLAGWIYFDRKDIMT